jgi:hypothetical protein
MGSRTAGVLGLLAVALLGGGCKAVGDGRDDLAAVNRDRELQRARDEQQKSPFLPNNLQPSNGEQAYFTQQANRVK